MLDTEALAVGRRGDAFAPDAADGKLMMEVNQRGCTQNVYSLHEQAGSRNAAHMHGELVAGPTIGFVRVERPVNWIVTARL